MTDTLGTVKADANPKCSICEGEGWHWGWNNIRNPVRLRCPCVDQKRNCFPTPDNGETDA